MLVPIFSINWKKNLCSIIFITIFVFCKFESPFKKIHVYMYQYVHFIEKNWKKNLSQIISITICVLPIWITVQNS